MPAVKSLLFALVATAWATYTFAQDQPPLQEVLVTAQKRVEDVQKVPISIAVIDNAAFDELSIQNLADVANHTPGVDYQVTGPKNLLSIRGIYSGGGAATSAIYIDDVPLQVRVGIVGLVGATLPAVFDLDRVEVLRGPQGTLFGSSAEGGAIRFITPEPSLSSYSGYSRADVGYIDDGSWSYELGAAYGGPIVSDELGFRVSAWHRRDGGYVDHISAIPGGYVYPDSNWSDSDVVRGELAFAPTSSFHVIPSLYYQHLYYHDSSGFEPADSPAYNDAFTQQWASLNPHYSNVSAGEFVNAQLQQTPATDTFWLPALKLQFDLTGMQLISNTGYLYRTNTTNEDFTTATPAAFGLPWPTVPEAADHNIITTTQNVLTEDLRLQSADSGRALEWTVGLWFNEARQRNYNPEISPYLPTLLPGPPPIVLLQPGNLSYIGDERSTDKQYALYGQATYRFTRQWSVVAGARVAHDSVDYSIYQAGPFYGPAAYISGTQSETVVDPKVGINFQLDDNNLFYVSAAKGDRVGGVNAPFPVTPGCEPLLAEIGLSAFPPTFKGDSLWSYEIGSKNRLLDGHLVTQGSAFYIDWSNVQQAVSLPPSLCPETFTGNLGKARSYGFDLQLAAQVGPVELGLAIGYTNATNTQSLGPTTQYVSDGQQINPYSVPWTVVPSVEYSFAFNGKKGYLRADDEFHSKNPGPAAQQIMSNVAYDPNFITNPSTNVLNVHLGMQWSGWDTSIYVLNVTNTHPRLYSQELEFGQFLGPTWTVRPLTFGTRAVYRW